MDNVDLLFYFNKTERTSWLVVYVTYK